MSNYRISLYPVPHFRHCLVTAQKINAIQIMRITFSPVRLSADYQSTSHTDNFRFIYQLTLLTLRLHLRPDLEL